MNDTAHESTSLGYPAYATLGADLRLGLAAWEVYMYLLPPRLSFHEVREVRVYQVAKAVSAGRRHVSYGLDWLVQHKYLLEHGRDNRGVRRLTLAWAVRTGPAEYETRMPGPIPPIPQDDQRLATGQLRWRVLERDGHRCQGCGASPSIGAVLHVDHIVPWSRGGRTTYANLRALCEACNLGKSNLMPMADR